MSLKDAIVYARRYLPLVLTQVASKGIAAYKDILIADSIGLNEFTDIYFLYLALPGYITSLFAGSLQPLLIPYFSEPDRKTSPYSLALFFARRSLYVVFAILGIGALARFFGRLSSFEFTCITCMTATLPAAVVSSTCISYLAAHKRSGLIAVLCAINPILSTISLCLLVELGFSYWSLPLAFALGFIFDVLVTSRTSLKLAKGLSDVVELKQKHWNSYRRLVSSTIIFGLAPSIDGIMTTVMLDEKDLTIYTFGIRLVAVCNALGATMVNLVLFPDAARQFAHRSKDRSKKWFRGIINSHLILIFISSSLGALAMYILGEQVIRLLYLQNKTGEADVAAIYTVFVSSVIQVPFYLAGVYGAKISNLFDGQRELQIVALAGLIINVVLNFILISSLGVKGVALSTTLVYVFTAMFINLWYIRRWSR